MTKPSATRGTLASARVPRYMTIARTLQAEIQSGALPIGAGLPTEVTLAQRFSASRHSIREALRHLREAGLISSKQGSGSRVAAVSGSERFVHAVSSLSELSEYAQSTHLQVLDHRAVAADGALAVRLNCTPGRRWLKIQGVRRSSADGSPTAWVEVFVHIAYAAIRRQLGKHRGGIFELIEHAGGERIIEVTQTIRGTTLEGPVAQALVAAPGSAAVEVERVYRNSRHKVLEIAFTTQAAAEFSYTARLLREPG